MKTLFKDRLQLAGLIVFGYLIVLSVVFFKERMIAYDSANYVFEIDQLREYCLPHGRWSSVLSQTIPLLLLKAGCSLKTFLIAYSVNLVAIWYLVFLIVTLGFRNRNAGMILIFSMTAGFSWMFYYAISELLSGMTMAVLLYAALEWKPKEESWLTRAMRYVAVSFSVIIASFYHELALIPIIFVAGFRLVKSLPKPKLSEVVPVLIIIAWSIARLKFLTLGHSIGNKILSVDDYLNHMPELFSLPAWGYFISYISDLSRWIGYSAFVAILILLLKRKWLIVVYSVLFSFGYGALVALTYFKGESSLMMETYMPPLGIYAAILFLETESHGVRRGFIRIFLVFAVFISCCKIYSGADLQSRRLNYLERMTDYAQSFSERKLIVKQSAFMEEIYIVPWAMPMESLIYSSIGDSSETITITFHRNPDSLITGNESEIFFTGECKPGWIYPDGNNIRLPRTQYRLVNTSQADSSFRPEDFNCANLDLIPESNEEVVIPYHQHGYVNVKIRNTSGQILRSVPEGDNTVEVGYRIYDLQGKEVQCSSYKTPLEADVYTEFTQCVRVESPPDAGDYILIIDLFNNGRWLNANAVIRLSIPGKSPFRFL